MSESLGLGKIITKEQHRDAVHVAVSPETAAAELDPGEHVYLRGGKAWPHHPQTGVAAIGIVDPFLLKPVQCGQRFWLFLYPGSITSLRHEWTHPAMDTDKQPVGQPAVSSESVKWLETFAARAELEYEELIQAAHAYMDSNDYLCEGDKWDGFEMPDEFWTHFAAVTGRVNQKGGSFFSCAC